VDANQKKAMALGKTLSEAAFKKANAQLQDYRENRGNAMIFGAMAGGNILAADKSSLDTTAKVLEYLNEESK
jgi:hypothetical protein